jgi:predicted DsbA family dithiol-disulfide isomerase
MALVSVEMWMDFGCPWSRMSLVELQRAAARRGDTLEVRFHGLRLDADAPADYGRTTIENLCDHLSISEDEAMAMLQKVLDVGLEVGVGFNFQQARGASTLDAHRLMKLTYIYGKQSDLALVLWRAHFEDGLLMSDRSVLMACAEEVGVPAQEALRVLTSGEFEAEVVAGEKDAAERGIERTPHFVFANGRELSGMQFAADFEAVLG